jgi:hypothetical protein
MPHYEYLNRYQLINVYLNVNDMTNFNPLILQKMESISRTQKNNLTASQIFLEFLQIQCPMN